MIPILLVSAALAAACYATALRTTRQRFQHAAQMLFAGFVGLFAAAVTGLLFGDARPWFFVFAFAGSVWLEYRAIRQREAKRQQLLQLAAMRDVANQMASLIRHIKGAS